MGIRHAAFRAVIGATLLSVVAGAGTASAQTVYPGGGNATLTFDVTTPKSIVFGGTAAYTIKITNTGPDLASAVKLASVTLPAAPDGISTLNVSAVTGCTPEDATGKVLFPCDVAAIVNTPDPLIVKVTVKWVAPTDADGNVILPTTCPSATAAMGDVGFDFTTTTNPATFPVTGPGAAIAVDQFTDVGIAIDGPVNGAVGQTITYTGTVTNNGPCPAANVVVSPVLSSPVSLLAFQSGTGPICTTADEISGGACNTVVTMAPGEKVTFTNTYKIASLPDSVTQTTIPIEYDVATDTADVNSSNDAATSGIRVGKEGGGCSSGGPGGLLAVALMAAAVFAARRRRTA